MNYIYNAYHHFLTITKHKCEVMKNCFAVGLYRQGLLHDLSKYSWEEFATGVKYYQGNRSPNAAEKEEKGYSAAWLHHKGRNKHHFEYWIDFAPDKSWGLVGNKMPLRYLIEMVMDRIAASKVYKGKDYTDACAWEYFERGRDFVVHPGAACAGEGERTGSPEKTDGTRDPGDKRAWTGAVIYKDNSLR